MGSVEIGVEGIGEKRVPEWFGEAVLYGKYWSESGLVDRLRSQVKVNRGRMGQYEVMDFVLLLNSYAISGEASLKEFFKALSPVSGLVMGLWERERCPVASSLSRFLRDVDDRSVEALRELFEEEMGQKGISVREEMWMRDRMGNRYVMFDVDGTVKAVRQRYVSESDRYPAARRRSAEVSKPGYRGRKRGEAVRTRTTVAVAHTSEWIGSYGSAGNGDVAGDLERSLARMQGYLESQGLRVSHGIVRLDGLYGSPKLVSQVQQNGIGYLMRSRDYSLLKHPVVVARMQESEGWEAVKGREFEQRKDIGYIEDAGRGYSSPFRLIVVRSPEGQHNGRIGKRYKGQVYELFITSQSASSLQSGDVLSLYFGRGGFERRLKEEDEEQEMDRWCSWSASGQEFWQILSQWVWNWRVWMGWQQAETPPVRETLWSEEKALPEVERLESEEMLPLSLWLLREQHCPVKVPAGKTPPAPMIAKAWERYGPLEVKTERVGEVNETKRYGSEDFQVIDAERVVCPAGYEMSQSSSRQEENGDWRYQFSLSGAICQKCEVKGRCLSPQTQGKSGKRLSVVQRQYRADPQSIRMCSAFVRSVIERLSEPNITAQAIVWRDIAATQLRRSWRQQLAGHELEIELLPPEAKRDEPDSVAMQSRHQREHHRLSWEERDERNRRALDGMRWKVVLWEGVERLIQALQRLIEQKPGVSEVSVATS